jgi:hypothetical protein
VLFRTAVLVALLCAATSGDAQRGANGRGASVNGPLSTAVVRGVVTDHTWRAIPNATVQSFLLTSFDAGSPKFLQRSRSTRTDASGRYEMELPIRPTIIAVLSSPTETRMRSGGGGAGESQYGYPTLFYPNVTSASRATVLALVGGEQASAVDFHQTLLRAVEVSGRIEALPADAVAPEALLMFDSADPLNSTIPVTTTSIASDGRFSFPRVPPGEYVIKVVQFPTLSASIGTHIASQTASLTGMTTVGDRDWSSPIAPMSMEPCLWGESRVRVADDPVSLILGLRAGVRFRGRVEFDGTAPAPSPEDRARLEILLQTADGRELRAFQIAALDPDNQFVTASLPPGAYRFAAVFRLEQGQTSPWRHRSTLLNGQELADGVASLRESDVSGITLRLTDRPR